MWAAFAVAGVDIASVRDGRKAMMVKRFMRLRTVGVIMAMMIMTIAGGLHGTAATQNTAGTKIDFYGYFSDSGLSSLMLGHMQPNDPGLAAELVSPQYADDFFSSFKSFTNYDFAADLPYTYIDQIDEADEYMVFAGSLDFYDGVKPGYVIFLSTSQQVFLLIGYQEMAGDLFGLAALTIQQGTAPAQYLGYVRLEMTDDGDVASQNGGAPSNQTEASGNEYCYIEPSFATLDLNDDERLTFDELEFWVDVVPETQQMIDTMKANGYDSVRYAGC
jgi:hypothetical protein